MNKQWKVKAISGSSGGVADVAEVNLHVVAPGYTVDGVARLTEAAPELLAAAKRALSILKALGYTPQPKDVLGALEAAIAKATQS